MVKFRKTFSFAIGVYLINKIHSMLTQSAYSHLYWVLIIGVISCNLILKL